MSQKMTRVVHLCYSDIQGGAARSAYRLHDSLRNVDVDSRMCVMSRQSSDVAVNVLPQVRTGRSLSSRVVHGWERRRLERILARRTGNVMFTLDSVPCSHEALPAHDVVNVHWISGFLDSIDLARMVPAGNQFVWTLHDMNPFTGGCHFSGTCNRYVEACGCCPVLESEVERDIAWRIWNRKMRGLRAVAKRARLVSPSRWLAEAAASSSVLRGVGIQVIPYGIDLDLYRPSSELRASMRSILGIPSDMIVLLVLAARLSDPRKGGEAFFTALASSGIMSGSNKIVLAVGKNMPVFKGALPLRATGAIEDETLLSAIYNCADLLLMPTISDNLPNAALEAIACGLPVMSYDTGGMPDIVGSQEAGMLVPKGDVKAFMEATRTLIADPSALSLRREYSRRRAEKCFAKEMQASKYKSLYDEILSSSDMNKNGGVK